MTGHFLVLERLAGILTAAGRTMRAMRDGNAVTGAQASEIPALHRTSPAFAGGGAGDIHILADHEMVGGNFGTDRYQPGFIDPEFGKLALRLDFGDREMAAVGFGRALHLAWARTKLQRNVAVLFLGAMSDDLAMGKAQNRHRHMFTGLSEQPHHSDFLCEHSGTHCSFSEALTA